MDLTAEQLRIYQIFFPYAFNKQADIRTKNGRLVHYTSAEAAVSMVQTKEVWMRNATVVNDFMEIEHGFRCLNEAYKGPSGKQFKSVLNGVYPAFSDELEKLFNSWLPHFRTDTYITSLSEHLPSEDLFGRLSMWRAYGGMTGVAVVLNNKAFLSQSDVLKAYSSPVAYLSVSDFAAELQKIVDAIQANINLVSKIPKQELITVVFTMMRYAILCTKHPGFHEEREWRIIYSPTYEKSKEMKSAIQTIKGVPQAIYRIPLKDFPEQGLVGAEIPELVERVIIGPTQYPLPIRTAIVSLLEEAGLKDAQSKVLISDIPLRQ